MRRTAAVAAGVLAVSALGAGAWAGNGSRRRAEEITSLEGSIEIKPSGVLNTTVDVYDGNDIANAGFDFDLVENHREALRQLGFISVHIETATGQTLDKPL
jgi:hypothetical protein